MKHEKGREGEITDTADTSKHSEETQQGKAAQHRQRAEEPNMLWDYTVGLVRAVFKVPLSVLMQFVNFLINLQ